MITSPHGLLRRALNLPAPLMLLIGMFALHTGSALAVRAFDAVGPAGVTWLRLTWAALLLLAVGGRTLGPAIRRATPRDLGSVVILGTVSAGMMALYSEATARIDLGTATALEFLGPLAVAVFALRRRRELVWIAAAAAGVLLLTRPWSGSADLAGVGLGLAGAACVALYILLTQRVGGSFGAVHGLGLALAVAALVMTPFGAPPVVAAADGRILLTTLAIALLYPLLPFLVEMVVLQRMSRTAYSTFISLEPAISLVTGALIIAQTPLPVQVAGMALVVVAGIGAARGDTAPPPRDEARSVADPEPEAARRPEAATAQPRSTPEPEYVG
ncbi:DMT family transporter [Nocardiopsis sediminis]|uniref:DMT family transporter n=1 Tax=Nocardiopsis sediminis TaxID=1778267 RepID=A0ABV8FMP2_9ACTN